MRWPSAWHDWLTAQWQAPRPAAALRVLAPLSWLYAGLVWVHRSLYRMQLLSAARAPVPVVVIGNLVVGGAGKTPTVIALVQWLQQDGWTPGVISRGYGRQGHDTLEVHARSSSAASGDEPLLIHLRTHAPVVVGRDRVAAARTLCDRHPEVNVLVADDGLQHLRLHRDVEILVFDDRGIGNGRLLPSGPLRSPAPVRANARSLVLYTAGRVTTHLKGFVGRRHLLGLLPLTQWWTTPGAPAIPLQHLADRTVHAAAGIARPEAFFRMLEVEGLRLVRHPLPDHHAFDETPWPRDAQAIVVTEKDAAKLPPHRIDADRIWVARLDFTPEDSFFAAVRSLLPTTP